MVTLDYIAVLIYLLLMAGIGIFSGWFIKDTSSYFRGNGGIPWPIAGISNFMSLFSTFVFIAYAGIAYEYGLVSLTVFWCTVPPGLIAAFVFSKRWRRTGIQTPVEYLETRFNSSTRQLFSWGGLLMRFLDNMVRLYAVGVFLSAATPLSLEIAILTAGIIIALYTVIGGLWAVAVMDTLQFVVLIFSALILLPLSLKSVGGFSGISNSSPQHLDWFNGPKGQPLWLLVYYVMISLKYNANWTFIQRFYSVRDEKDAKKVGILTSLLFLIFPIVFLLPPLVANIILPDLPDKEMAYVALSTKLLPAGIMGLMLASMFAATMSSLNSEYNVMAGVLTNDVYQRMIRPDAKPNELLWVGRLTTVVIGAIMMLGALYVGRFGGAFEANKLFTGLFAIPLAVPLIFGILLRKPRPWGAAATVLIGALAGLILNTNPNVSWEMATLIEIILCVVIFIASGRFGSHTKEADERTVAFFKKLKTPLAEKEKPIVGAGFKQFLANMFTIALAVSGFLFMAMSVPSLADLSGQLAMGAGLICLLIALIVWRFGRKKVV